jgi:hypothetical protein
MNKKRFKINFYFKEFINLHNQEGNKSYYLINLASLIISIVIFIAFLIFPTSLPHNSLSINIFFLFISTFLLLTPSFFTKLIFTIKKNIFIDHDRYDPFLTFLFFLFLIAISLITSFINLLFLIIIIGFFALLFFLLMILRNKLLKINSLVSIVIIIVLSFFLIISMWGSKFLTYYSSPIFYEKLFTGKVFIDPLFHGTVSNMFKNYGTSSTGLDGTVAFNYHYFSHWIFAQLSKLTNVNSLYFYQTGYPIIFVPLFFKFFLLIIKRISNPFKDTFFNNNIFWLSILTTFSFIFPKFIQERFFVSNFELISESYNLSLTFSFITILMILFFVDNNNVNKSFRITKQIFFLIFLPFLIYVIGFLKSSTMIVFVAILGYIFIRYNLFKKITYIISIISVTLSGFLTLKILSGTGFINYGIDFFHFFKVVVMGRNKELIWPITLIMFIFIYFFWAIIFIILKIIDLKKNGSGSFKIDFKLKKTISIEIVILTSIVGILPGIFFKFHGGSASYFSDIQRWLSIILLLSFFIDKGYFKQKFLATAKKSLTIFFIFVMFISFLFNFYTETKSFLEDYLKNKTEFARISENQFNNDIEEYRKILINKLLELDKLPISLKSKTLIYIPASNTIFWELKFFSKSLSVPLMVPAISGIAMIDGLPARSQVYVLNFGYSSYKQFEEIKYNKSVEEIFFKTRTLGFENLIILNFQDKSIDTTYINESNISGYMGEISKLIERLNLYLNNEELSFMKIYNIVNIIKENPESFPEYIKDMVFKNELILKESNTEFITSLYRILLDREPDKAGLDFWVLKLDKGETKNQIFDKFIQSGEFKTKYEHDLNN